MRVLFTCLILVLFTDCVSKKIAHTVSRSVSAVNFKTDTIPALQNYSDSSLLRDIDGNYYKTIKIGTQTWMAENLRTTRYRDGTPISFYPDNETWQNSSSAAYCWINNDSSKFAFPYGALYNWYTVNTGKLCPEGWHVPSNYEWIRLVDYLGGESVAGGKLKEADTIHWSKPNTGATNESGFTAIPAGGRSDDGTFGNFGQSNIFWVINEFDSKFAWFRNISYYYSDIFGYCYNKKNGFSVRCIKDK